MKISTLLGYVGSFLFAIRMFPQIYDIYINNKINGLSESFIILDLTAALCLLVYSFSIKAVPMIITNSMAAICDIILYIMYIKIVNEIGTKPSNSPGIARKGGLLTEKVI